MLEPLRGDMPRRNRSVLLLGLGVDLTQQQIGARMRLSQMHVSRLLRRSLAQLQDAATGAGD